MGHVSANGRIPFVKELPAFNDILGVTGVTTEPSVVSGSSDATTPSDGEARHPEDPRDTMRVLRASLRYNGRWGLSLRLPRR